MHRSSSSHSSPMNNSDSDEVTDDHHHHHHHETATFDEELPPDFIVHNNEIQPISTQENLGIFFLKSESVQELLGQLKIMFIGDSMTRGIYKDLLVWLQGDEFIREFELKGRLEESFRGDRMVDVLPLHKDRIFRQAREYISDDFAIQYQFTTRTMKEDIERLLMQWDADGYPDVIFMNSALWDLSRYDDLVEGLMVGTTEHTKAQEISVLVEYCHRVSQLMRRLRSKLPPSTTFVWVCMPNPIPPKQQHGFLSRPDTKRKNHIIRTLIIDGNCRAAQIVRNANYDVCDLGFYMRNHAMFQYRIDDGVHWNSVATRLQTQLLMMHLARTWDISFRDEYNLWKARNMGTEEQQRIVNAGIEMLDLFQKIDKGGEAASSTVHAPHYVKFQDKIASTVLQEQPNLLEDVGKWAELGRAAMSFIYDYDIDDKKETATPKKQTPEMMKWLKEKSEQLLDMAPTAFRAARGEKSKEEREKEKRQEKEKKEGKEKKDKSDDNEIQEVGAVNRKRPFCITLSDSDEGEKEEGDSPEIGEEDMDIEEEEEETYSPASPKM